MFRRLFYLIILGAVAWFAAGFHPITAEWRERTATFVAINSTIQSGVGWVGDQARELATEYLGVQFEDEEGGEEADVSNEEEVAESFAPQSASSGAGDEQTFDQYRAWIGEARASHPYPESEERMYAVMMCESGGDAAVVNSAGPNSGLFQYNAATWSGDWNTYRNEAILDPRAQIFATALAWSNGMQSQWGCYSRAH